MNKNRMEAFSDGVVAILITIMILELRPPAGSDWAALQPIIPSVLAYVLSFIYIGIYWNNHHHMLHATDRINGTILWANLHLLFWLSLIPFTTAWMGRNYLASVPTALYGCVLIMCAIAYFILQNRIIKEEGPDSRLAAAIGGDRKGFTSLVLYASAIPLAFVRPWLADLLYATVAVLWFVPDSRIENRLRD
ncbi:MAG: TMEM175 family protein [Gemmatimonadaceae bacterium]